MPSALGSLALALCRDPQEFGTINVRFVDHTLKVKSNVQVGSYTTIEDLKESIIEKMKFVAKDTKFGKCMDILIHTVWAK